MEVFQAYDNYIIQTEQTSLWCNRFDGSLSIQSAHNVLNSWNPVCLGLIEGIVGRVKKHPDSTEWTLIVIIGKAGVGCLPDGSEIFKITSVGLLPLSLAEPPVEFLMLRRCPKHHSGLKPSVKLSGPLDLQQKSLQKTWTQIKVQMKSKKGELSSMDKFEKKISEEILRMFDKSDSFYFSPDSDITNSHQRKLLQKQSGSFQYDDTFFWNKPMLEEIIDSNPECVGNIVVPIIQGFVQFEKLPLDLKGLAEVQTIQLGLISRRSRFRAGTRYRRRGIDHEGRVANFVETEQFLHTNGHTVSVVLLRGSVPLFWSQIPTKYRPNIRVELPSSLSRSCFNAHFDMIYEKYGKISIINLCDRTGRELPLIEAYTSHILDYNSENLTYIGFDFHDYCRGMKFDNVSILLDSIPDVLKTMAYCWSDDNGIIVHQNGVFRVNCIDCLDRTNVVQSSIAKEVIVTQLRKLGLVFPDEEMPNNFRILYNNIWANNGDCLSRQYAGTAALKGDYTRTGERKLSGMMKDGVSSANRYYLNRFRDLYRQIAIDLIMRQPLVSSDLALLCKAGEEDQCIGNDGDSLAGYIKREFKKAVIAIAENCLCDFQMTNWDSQSMAEVVLLVTSDAYYVGFVCQSYIVSYIRVPLKNLLTILISRDSANLRLFHTVDSAPGVEFWVTLTPTLDPVITRQAIMETFAMAHAANGLAMNIREADTLETRDNCVLPQMQSISLRPKQVPVAKPNAKQYLRNIHGKFTASISRKLKIKSFANSVKEDDKPSVTFLDDPSNSVSGNDNLSIESIPEVNEPLVGNANLGDLIEEPITISLADKTIDQADSFKLDDTLSSSDTSDSETFDGNDDHMSLEFESGSLNELLQGSCSHTPDESLFQHVHEHAVCTTDVVLPTCGIIIVSPRNGSVSSILPESTGVVGPRELRCFSETSYPKSGNFPLVNLDAHPIPPPRTKKITRDSENLPSFQSCVPVCVGDSSETVTVTGQSFQKLKSSIMSLKGRSMKNSKEIANLEKRLRSQSCKTRFIQL